MGYLEFFHLKIDYLSVDKNSGGGWEGGPSWTFLRKPQYFLDSFILWMKALSLSASLITVWTSTSQNKFLRVRIKLGALCE